MRNFQRSIYLSVYSSFLFWEWIVNSGKAGVVSLLPLLYLQFSVVLIHSALTICVLSVNRNSEQTYGHGERGGEGEIYGKSNVETYIPICKIESQGELAIWLRNLKQELCINLEGWEGEGGGAEDQKGGDICTPMADSRRAFTENSKIP